MNSRIGDAWRRLRFAFASGSWSTLLLFKLRAFSFQPLAISRGTPCYTQLPMLQETLEQGRLAADHALERLLPPETQHPTSIHKAMRHSVFAGGKRLRPILCMEAAHMVAGSLPAGVEELGAALEMLHTYSLIHDDLPALDNDDLRRGRPTCHVVFGEAIAILAGDALQTQTYEVLARLRCAPEARVRIIEEIAHGTGTIDGMIAAADKILSLADNDTKIVPGHGPLGNKADLMKSRDMLITARDRIQKLKSAGKSALEAVADKPFADLDPVWGKGIINSEQFVQIVYLTL